MIGLEVFFFANGDAGDFGAIFSFERFLEFNNIWESLDDSKFEQIYVHFLCLLVI